MSFTRVNYNDLNSRQQENFNFAKLAGVLAEYGFTALRLSDDWKGADLIAVHIEGERDIKIQLKERPHPIAAVFYLDREGYLVNRQQPRCRDCLQCCGADGE